jgi:hypothetical protein
MPSPARRDVIDESVVGTYHIWSRVMLREFLLGRDPKTGRDHSHRKEKLQQRLEALLSVFSIECLDRSTLDNHFHQILRNRPDVVAQWSDREVAQRWLRLKRSQLKLLGVAKEKLVNALVADTTRMAEVRRRLSSISWFMAYFREPLARVFNMEMNTTGSSFWAGRFGCSRLEDETSLLACSVYVNMNQIRAGMAASVEGSVETSVHDRLQDRRSGDPLRPRSGWLSAVHVDGDGYSGVAAGRRASDKGYLEMTFDEYLELLERVIQRERTGRLEPVSSTAIERLGIDTAAWEQSLRLTSRKFGRELEISAQLAAEARKSRAP